MFIGDYEGRYLELEKDISTVKSLLEDLHRQLDQTTDDIERGKLEVNIEDATIQLNNWEYALSGMTQGKE